MGRGTLGAMSQPPEGPEQYSPPPAPVPIPPPPPSISEAAAQYSGGGDNPYAQNPAYHRAPSTSGSGAPVGLAVASLVIGIVALLTGWIPVWGIVLGLLAAILGFVAIGKKQSKGLSIAGIITGIIGAIMSTAVLVALIAGANWISDPDNWPTFSYDPDNSYDPGDLYYNGDSTTIQPDAGGTSLSIAEQAFGKSESNPEVWWFAVILDNPNSTSFPAADITVQALAADGTVLDDNWTYRAVAPGKTALVGNFWDVGGGEIASLQVLGPPADALSSSTPEGGLELSDFTVESNDWSTTVSGTVTSTFGELKYGAVIAVVARDDSGAIIGVANAYVGELAAGATEKFEAFFYDTPVPDAKFEAYPWPY